MNPHYCKLLYRWNLFLKWAARKLQRENSTLLNTLKGKMHQQVKKKDKQERYVNKINIACSASPFNLVVVSSICSCKNRMYVINRQMDFFRSDINV